MTGAAGTTFRPKGPSERERRIIEATARPKKGGKILTMRQLRKMSSILARRMFRDANGGELLARDRKQATVAYGVLVDKLVILAPHDRGLLVEHDGAPDTQAAMRELGLRIAEIGRATPPQDVPGQQATTPRSRLNLT